MAKSTQLIILIISVFFLMGLTLMNLVLTNIGQNLIYHFYERSSSCPQCRQHNPETHRIFIEFDEVNDQKVEEIQLQLNQTEKSRSELQLQLDDVERDFFQIQGILIETENKIKELEAENQVLKVQNDSREQEMGKIITNCNLNASEEAELLQVKISSLEDKEREMLLEFEQKIEECFKFTEENSKLQKQLERNDKMYVNTRYQYEAVEKGLKVQIDHLNKRIFAATEIIENQKCAIKELSAGKKLSEERSENKENEANNEDIVGEYRKIYTSINNETKSPEMAVQQFKNERELEKCKDKIMELEEKHMRSKEIFDFEMASLKADNERKEIEIKNRKEEHMKLIHKLSSMGSKTAEITLRRKNEVLSAKLEEVQSELQKFLVSPAEKDILIKKLQHSESMLLSNLDVITKQGQHKGHQVKLLPKSVSSDVKASNEQVKNASFEANKNEATSILIRGVPECFIKTPLTDTILLFSEIMAIPCQYSDINFVRKLDNKFKNRRKLQKESIALVVKFSNLNMKNNFLTNKDKLKGIQIFEYLDNETNALFNYAKSLRSIGYQHIFSRNNNIFARFNFTSPAIKINSKQEVDEIIQKSNGQRERIKESVKETKSEQCDDDYYCKEDSENNV